MISADLLVMPAPRYVIPAPRYVIPAPRYVMPAPRYVIPAEAGIQGTAPRPALRGVAEAPTAE